MLEKLISIKGVGRFQNCKAAGDVSFGKNSLIFAENGRGKTTLCAILRSLQTGMPAYIMGRQTIGGEENPPEVQIRLNGGNAVFRNGQWNQQVPDIAIFDSTFVAENVFSGDCVEIDHRRNLYNVIIGKAGVDLAHEVNAIDAAIKIKNGEIKDKKAFLESRIPDGVMDADYFITLPKEDDSIDSKVADKERDLQAVKQSAQLQRGSELEQMSLPAVPDEFLPILAKTIDGVEADAERQITAHIETHNMQERGKTWLSEGCSYIHDDNCPFCGQDLTGVDLIEAYKGFFSAAYNALKEEIKALSDEISDSFGDLGLAQIDRVLHKNAAAVEFWSQYCDITAPALQESDNLIVVLARLRQSALNHLERKAQAPLEQINPDVSLLSDFEILRQFQAAIVQYNQAVDTANALIRAKKEQAQGREVRQVETELAKLKAAQRRCDQQIDAECTAYRKLLMEKKDLEDRKTAAKEKLDEYTQSIITKYEKTINEYLDCFNAGFQITETSHGYRGGAPSTSYQILINQMPVDLGNSDTPIDQPSFKNTLSSGDRSALALSFFLAQLEHDPDKANKIVVFDDPFNSQDDFRKGHTAQRIKKCGRECAQVIVLSHDQHFLKLVWDDLPTDERKTFQLFRISEKNTGIAEWDIEKAVQARYRADIDTLSKYYTSANDGNQRDVVQKIRPVLEGYCRNLYPTRFADNDALGTIVGKIKGYDDEFPLKDVCDELEELNGYSRRYHHGENPNAATEAINDNELKGYVKRTLKVVGALL